jgi:hypothetical protein
MPLASKVSCASSAAGCDVALDFIFLCVSLMALFYTVAFFSGIFSIGVYFVVSQSWRGVMCLSCWWIKMLSCVEKKIFQIILKLVAFALLVQAKHAESPVLTKFKCSVSLHS